MVVHLGITITGLYCCLVLVVLNHSILIDTHPLQPTLLGFFRINMTASSHPSFVLVPGAFHQPLLYEKLVTLLKSAGYPVSVASLPSCDAQNPQNVTCATDAEAIRKQIVHSMEADGKDVVVVCHSYGGIPGGGAACGLGKVARAKDGKKGGVVGLVYVCSFVVPEGSSLLEILGGKHAPYVDVDKVPISSL